MYRINKNIDTKLLVNNSRGLPDKIYKRNIAPLLFSRSTPTTDSRGLLVPINTPRIEKGPTDKTYAIFAEQGASLTLPSQYITPSEGTFTAGVYIPSWMGTTIKNSTIIGHATSSLQNTIGFYHDNLSGLNRWVFRISDGFGNTQLLITNNTLSVGWHTIKLTWSPTRTAFYWDDVLASELTTGVVVPATSPTNFRIGAWWDGGSAWNSLISTIRISDLGNVLLDYNV